MYSFFNEWSEAKLQEVFQLEYRPTVLLDDWLDTYSELSPLENETLQVLQKRLNTFGENWTKSDALFSFIAPLFHLADMHTPHFRLFHQENLFANVADHHVFYDTTDLVIGGGTQQLGNPYFCLGVYERNDHHEFTPEGQFLASLLAAHHMNKNVLPIYGALVVDNHWWYFGVLQGNQYALSQVYLANKNSLTQIYMIIKELKQILLDLQQANASIFHSNPTPVKMLNFRDCTTAQLRRNFQLKRTQSNQLLKEWLNQSLPTNSDEEQVLLRLQKKLTKRVDNWNEQELIKKFIAPLVGLVNFDTPHFQEFANRSLSLRVGNVELSGKVDVMVAQGIEEPERPYFCFHEYKKEKGCDNDPLGQVVAAMYTAQQLNHDDFPIYGAYVVGRQWFFVVLHKNTYCVSLAYDATKQEIFDIYRILKTLKTIIAKVVETK
ncbi:hypothetical protein [Microscilla marina]|uniref:Uncharacterized protein n=1 Tax=Microscilla marina ATCC 23134 TaxID=313606 RepID=A1ZJI4_MICM2|nr:hypothetical protein [Microscilla marina]EAY29287.1 hypothetical protein M23134_01341 [Microscilla marina ATCC 23134]